MEKNQSFFLVVHATDTYIIYIYIFIQYKALNNILNYV